jgi:hypothetical protein
MARKSNQELAAQVAQAASTEAKTGGGRKKGRRKKGASASCEINTKDAEKAISTVGHLIRGIEKATGGKFMGRVAKATGGGGGFPAKKARRRK